MGVMGNPMKYSMVLAENEEESPWEPLHVEHGFKKEDSTLTVFYPNSYAQVLSYRTDDKGILSTMTYNLLPGRRDGLTCIVLIPSHAKTLARKGWSKRDIKAYISEFARVPFYQHPYSMGSFVSEDTSKIAPLSPSDFIRLIPNPEKIRLIVAGGPENFMGIIRGSSVATSLEDGEVRIGMVTKKIELPANWDKLVAKYKNVIPTYARY
ncbi:MAG: hypothetical protein A2144_12235 [Chloroflexi bacterium RBG_16_50_9]|nr:MAG: hypothetical protein A2144_12235 [Chloroflexi bacterium RBG_16_50_9]